jgi:hypothetical protein
MDPDMFKYVLFALVVAAPIHVAAAGSSSFQAAAQKKLLAGDVCHVYVEDLLLAVQAAVLAN